jgi:2-aminoethylphosphonate-pyruvate transaminase
MNIKTAIILAAGKGTRLRSVTGDEFPKPLTPLNDQPIIEYSIHALRKVGVQKILIGCGYMIESFRYLEEKFEEVRIVENPHYSTRASIYTFLIFESLVKEPFYLLEADILYDPEILEKINFSDDSQNKIVTSAPLSLDDNVYYDSVDDKLVKLTKDLGPGEDQDGVMTGIWALSKGFISRFSAFYNKGETVDYSEDYEIMLAQYSSEKEPIMISHFPELNWCEIDNEDHLGYALKNVLPGI